MAGEKEAVKLVGSWSSPFVMRARVALNLKKVPYEFIQVNPFEKTGILVEANPIFKKVPILLHGDRNICESMIIVEYIDKVWRHAGPSILPTDPYDCAMARFCNVFIDDKFFQCIVGLLVLVAKEKMDSVAAAAEQLVAALQLLEGELEKYGGGKRFFGGGTIGFVDIALCGFIAWIRVAVKLTGIELLDEAKTPLLVGWVDRFCALDAAKEVVPETDKLLGFFNSVFAPMLRAM